MTSTSLPSRLRESSFRKYEDDIASIVKNFPRATVIAPKGNVVTYVARLRDAILSFKTYHWVSLKINETYRFDEIVNELICAHRGDVVVCGSRQSVKDYDATSSVPGSSIVSQAGRTSVEMPGLTFAEIQFLCVLASKRLLTSSIIVDTLSVEGKTELELNYDVSIEESGEGKFDIS